MVALPGETAWITPLETVATLMLLLDQTTSFAASAPENTVSVFDTGSVFVTLRYVFKSISLSSASAVLLSVVFMLFVLGALLVAASIKAIFLMLAASITVNVNSPGVPLKVFPSLPTGVAMTLYAPAGVLTVFVEDVFTVPFATVTPLAFASWPFESTTVQATLLETA